MIIDILFLIVIVLAVIKGYSRGLIVAIFSVIGLIVGLAAAIKLSTVAADYLKDAVNIAAKWLPFISFVVVFLLAVFLVRLGALAIEKAVEFAMLGWINKIGGIVLYVILYITVFSVVLFYAEQMNLVSAETIAGSKTYAHIAPWGPKTIEAFGKIVPWFSNMFNELKAFFEGLKS